MFIRIGKENRPSCDYCLHRGINCEWPIVAPKSRVRRPISSDKSASSNVITAANPQQSLETSGPILLIPPRSIQLHDAPPVFTMEDMRLFNHFIQRAYPHHPSGNDSIWTHEIPSLASDVSAFQFFCASYYSFSSIRCLNV